jgi:hypothetical protein
MLILELAFQFIGQFYIIRISIHWWIFQIFFVFSNIYKLLLEQTIEVSDNNLPQRKEKQ